MLTTKKRACFRSFLLGSLPLILLGTGCTPPGPKALLQGERLINQGKYSEAISRLEEAVRLLPQEARAWNHLGLAFHHANDRAKAVQAYQKALSLDRNLVIARYNLGVAQFELGNFPAAADALSTFLALQPQATEAPDASLKIGLSQYQLALLASGADRNRQIETARRTLETVINQSPSPEAWNAVGVLHVQKNRIREAAASFTAALQLQAGYPPALLNLAILSQQHLNDRRAALRGYQEYLAASVRPPNAAAVEELVRQLDAELNPPPAKLVTTNVVAMVPAPIVATETNRATSQTNLPTRVAFASNPATNGARTTPLPTTNPPVAVVKGAPPGLIESTRLPDEPRVVAARDFDPASGSKPLTTPSRATPAPSGASEYAIAIPPSANGTDVSRYRYLSPSKPIAGQRDAAMPVFNRAIAAHGELRYAEAIVAYKQAVRLDPAYFEAWYNLGLAAYEANDAALALLAGEQALAITPDSTAARYNFALALQKANYPVDAAGELERLLRAHPNEARAHLSLANLYAQDLRQPSRARPHYLRLLDLEPRHAQATQIRYWLVANP